MKRPPLPHEIAKKVLPPPGGKDAAGKQKRCMDIVDNVMEHESKKILTKIDALRDRLSPEKTPDDFPSYPNLEEEIDELYDEVGEKLEGLKKDIKWYCMIDRANYIVYNLLDDLPASPYTFSTRREAENFKKEFIERYKDQGYYSSAIHARVSLEELPDWLEIREV